MSSNGFGDTFRTRFTGFSCGKVGSTLSDVRRDGKMILAIDGFNSSLKAVVEGFGSDER